MSTGNAPGSARIHTGPAGIAKFVISAPLEDRWVEHLRAAHPSIRFVSVAAADVPAEVRDAQALLASPEVDLHSVLALPSELLWVHSLGAGIDRWAGPRLRESPVLLTNGSGVHATNIAEHVLALILSFARNLPAFWESARSSRWDRDPATLRPIFELSGQTLAIAGLGTIGEALATRAAALGLAVVGIRRTPSGALPAGVEAVFSPERADEALARADHVANILPLTEETRGFFSRARLERFKPGARFYNVGRGATVDQNALVDLLRQGRIAGAGLDVVDPEPLPADHPLWKLPNVLITNHTAGFTPSYQERTVEIVLDNLGRIERGEELRNLVDKALGY